MILGVFWGYLGAILMGVTLGLVGAGGSILTVPILVYLFGTRPVLATAYSLFVVGLTALIGSFAYIRSRQVNFLTGAIFSIPSFIGVYLTRRYAVPAIPAELTTIGSFILTRDTLIMTVFAAVMLLASFSMIREKKPDPMKATAKVIPPGLRYALIALEGLIVGGVTGLVGAGGGFLIIPALVVLVGLPMKEAVGTSLLIIAVKSLFGFLGDLAGDQVIEWGFLGIFSSFSIVGILLGTFLSRFVPGSKLKPAFGWFVLAMAGVILYQQIYR